VLPHSRYAPRTATPPPVRPGAGDASMRDSLPPQRRQGGTGGGPGGGPGGRAGRSNLSPREGAEEAERRLGLPCFHSGQKVQGLFGCVACQKQIRNRGVLPTCPDCGEIIWAYMDQGPRPVPEGQEPGAAPREAAPQA